MKEVNDGNRYVPLWNKTLYKLKHYRYIRNNYVHEVGTSQYDICTRDDYENYRPFGSVQERKEFI